MRRLFTILMLFLLSAGLSAQEMWSGRLLIDIGADLTFYMLNKDDAAEAEAELQGSEAEINLALFLLTLRGGPIVDVLWQQSGNSWFGFETGLLAIQYGEDPNSTVLFNLPFYAVLRLRMGPIFLQPYVGTVLLGILSTDSGGLGMAYESGSKVGLILDDMNVYAIVGTVYSNTDEYFAGSFLMKYGFGASFTY